MGNDKMNDSSKKDLSVEINNKPIYKKKSLYIGILLILFVIATGVYWYLGTIGYISTDDAFVDANKLNISPNMLGRVVHLYTDESDTVYAGQLLAELDSTVIIAKLNQVISTLGNIKLEVSLAKIRLEQAQINFERAKLQFTSKVIPKEKFDNIQKVFQASKVQYEIAKSKTATIEAQAKVIKAELADTKLYSDISGVVAKRWLLTGDIAAPGQPIFTIYDLKNIWVTAMLKETDINSVAVGDSVEIDVDSYPNKKFTGKIFQIGNNTAAQFSLFPPSNASGNFTKVTQRIPVKISIENKNISKNFKYGLLPGMSVEIKLEIKQNE